ncbi:MAG: hypothetical protein NC924_05695 [Candidatus Omnitrophica bacterium]|nr:hypothetical protein [Candidatus Omnitrophota bacterium]
MRSDIVFQTILQSIAPLNVYEKRRRSDDYCELVFLNVELSTWNNIFTTALGQAVKPAHQKPDEQALRIAKDVGGISFNQTLFYRDFEDGVILVMFWPWQDGARTTLKMMRLPKKC